MIAAAPVLAICIVATGGVILRPRRWPEAIWAVAGALLLFLFGLIPVRTALAAVGKGSQVYLFLIGMMLLSETARSNGLFDWVAATAVNHARGSSARLFALVYASGIVITIFLSNDATAVVLTPAVYAAARTGRAEPLPLLFACAFVANAASFVLPISNPANLVLYAGHVPPLGRWLAAFALPSLASILVTYAVLRRVERKKLAAACAGQVERAPLSRGAKAAFAGIVATAMLLLTVSACGIPLGLPTCVAGIATSALACLVGRNPPGPIVRHVAWGILPLVAGLFVMVEALDASGVLGAPARALARASAADPAAASAGAGALLAFACNLMNNLPAGLFAATAAAQAHAPRLVVDGLLIGVDLGPNLSVTGSLATILWLAVIRREGLDVSFVQFLKFGAATMPPALAAALAVRLLL